MFRSDCLVSTFHPIFSVRPSYLIMQSVVAINQKLMLVTDFDIFNY